MSTEVAVSPAVAASARARIDPELYPFPPHFLEVEGGRLHYVDEGSGRPVVFVHGTPSWSFEWRHAILGLRDRFRCLAPDLLGFGLSDKPGGVALDPEAQAGRLRQWFEALDLRDVVLVVHDFGGPIGLPLALDLPDRVGAVMIVNSWMWAHGDRWSVRWMSRLVASPLGRWLYTGLNASPRWLLPSTFADRRSLTPEVHAHYLLPFPTRADREGPWALGCALAGADPWYASLWARREVLRGKPCTLLWGTRDPAFGEGYLARWREALPDARVVTAPVGHFPQEEAPDQVLQAVVELASRSG